jgi:hypothetical protein
MRQGDMTGATEAPQARSPEMQALFVDAELVREAQLKTATS